MVAPSPNTFDLLLDPIADCLTPEVADRIGRVKEAEARAAGAPATHHATEPAQ